MENAIGYLRVGTREQCGGRSASDSWQDRSASGDWRGSRVWWLRRLPMGVGW